ncbi:hypothetical protein BCR36DRAFT_148376 [Piromyces finnis]|uniref:Uncharacterized protein n=1 Tax=Piromyces finnis TaxID=1754191 RepID=A0A1Y1UZU1_9FUNG|nr:hypothetical protein BCR36DRAFT_148376 [Piromyces finnis]|eukprot:ORX42974.1 hypothetical protein BCR36DRAFT_148376 [Piromyces finnis]
MVNAFFFFFERRHTLILHHHHHHHHHHYKIIKTFNTLKQHLINQIIIIIKKNEFYLIFLKKINLKCYIKSINIYFFFLFMSLFQKSLFL